MTIIRSNSISGINSITAAPGANLQFFDSTGASLSLDTGNVNAGVVTATTVRVTGDLTVEGTTTTLDTVVTEVDKLEVNANNSTVGVAITQSGAGDILRLYDGASQVVTVDDQGNFGIGNTTPNAKLKVSGDAIFTQTSASIQTDCLQLGFTAPNGFIKSKNSSASPASNLDFYSTDTGGNTNLGIRLQYTGNIGIGTASPSGKLDVFDTSRIKHVVASNANHIEFWKDTTPTYAASIGLGVPAAGSITQDLTFSTYVNGGSWNERLRITSDGNIGINATNPHTKLNVQGTVSTGRNLAREFGTVIDWSSQFNTHRTASNVINGKKHYENGGQDWLTVGGSRANAYVVIDLGESRSVDRMVVYNQNEYSDSRREVKQFTLQGSNDNSTWTTVIVNECGKSNAHEPNPGWSFRLPDNWEDDNEGVSYRYWKFIMNTFHASDSYGGVMEIELYGSSDSIDDEVSTSSLVAEDVYSETGNFNRSLCVGSGYGGYDVPNRGDAVIEGSVGIGTDNPTTNLQINDASETTVSLYNGSTKKMAIQAQGGFGNIIYSYDSEPLIFSVASGSSYSKKMKIDADGHVTFPAQSKFLARRTSTQTYSANDIIVFDGQTFDDNGDYNDTTGVFTAPVTGKYLFLATVLVQAADVGDQFDILLNTSNRTYYGAPGRIEVQLGTSWTNGSGNNYIALGVYQIADMDQGDVASVRLSTFEGGSIYGTNSGEWTRWSGYLLG